MIFSFYGVGGWDVSQSKSQSELRAYSESQSGIGHRTWVWSKSVSCTCSMSRSASKKMCSSDSFHRLRAKKVPEGCLAVYQERVA